MPLGGVGEIGMNLSIYGFGSERNRNWLVGRHRRDLRAEEHLPGVDLILPDIRYPRSRSSTILPASCSPMRMRTISAPSLDLWPQLEASRSMRRPSPRRC